MQDKKTDITSDFMTITACAKLLSAQGDQTSSQNLNRYCKRHGLIEDTPGRFLMVSPARVADHRDSFSREVMKGEHLKFKSASKSKSKSKKPAAKTKSKPKLAAVPAFAAKSAVTPVTPVTDLDRARTAKAEREEAQADKARLELFKETRDLVATSEMEVLIGLLMTMLKEALFGVNLSDDTEAILAVNNLGDDRKKPTQAILKSRRRGMMQQISDLAEREMARLDPHHSGGFRARLADIIAKVQSLRDEEFDAVLNPKSEGRPA